MDRHGDCRAEHPLCAQQGHRQNGDTPILLTAEAIPQGGGSNFVPNHANIIGIYLTRATSAANNAEEEIGILWYMRRMIPGDPKPHRKVVVSPPFSQMTLIRVR